MNLFTRSSPRSVASEILVYDRQMWNCIPFLSQSPENYTNQAERSYMSRKYMIFSTPRVMRPRGWTKRLSNIVRYGMKTIRRKLFKQSTDTEIIRAAFPVRIYRITPRRTECCEDDPTNQVRGINRSLPSSTALFRLLIGPWFYRKSIWTNRRQAMRGSGEKTTWSNLI